MLAAWWLGAAAHAAPATCANPEIVVEGKPLELNYRDNNAVLRDVTISQCNTRIEAAEAQVTGGIGFQDSRWTFSGNVRIKAEGGSLRSDKAVVAFRNNLISTATITGTPAEFEQQRADGATSRGHDKTIDYETTGGTVSFRENAWLSDGCNEITGQQLVYNIKAQRVEGQARPAPGDDGRIRITIQPKPASGSPCAHTVSEKKP